MGDNDLYSIGDVGRRCGLSISTIRFYADNGVVAPTSVTAAGHRLYDVQAVARLEFVRTLREIGASLDEIRQLLADTTSLHDLATTHLALVQDQTRRLKAREAILRTIVQQNNPAEQVTLMHKLASMSDDERDRLIDQFWDEVTEGLQAHPALFELIRRRRPHLPAEPTTDQLEAWITLADLVQDQDFRRSLREAYWKLFSSDRSYAVTSPEVLDLIERHRRILVEAARAACEAGLPAESEPAREIADRVSASAAEISEYAQANGLTGTPHPDARQTHTRFVGLLNRYSTLVATVNGTPPLSSAGATQVQEWLTAARRDK